MMRLQFMLLGAVFFAAQLLAADDRYGFLNDANAIRRGTEQYWDFSDFANSTGRTVDLTAQVGAKYPELGGYGLQLMKGLSGFIQIGGYSNSGELVFSLDSSTADVLLLHVAKHANKDYGRTMPIGLASGADGTIRELAVITLQDEFATYPVPLPKLAKGDAIILHSTTNHLAAKDQRSAVNLAWMRLVNSKLARRRNPLILTIR